MGNDDKGGNVLGSQQHQGDNLKGNTDMKNTFKYIFLHSVITDNYFLTTFPPMGMW